MSKDILHKVEELLESCGLRKTHPRQEILSILLQTDQPLTQEQIAERIGPSAPDKTTIYRTLMTLAGRNLVHQAYLKDRTRHFELAHHCRADQCHPHFTCTDCGRTHCFHDAVIPAVKNIPAGFLVQHRQLRLEGICADCRKLSAGGH
jgi:Fur family ferric uptake transcriptional regulator